MFAKRKYARKRRPRRPSKRRMTRRRNILRPADPVILEKPIFDAAGASTYLWMYVKPGPAAPANTPGEHSTPQRVRSLRQICADAVAANIDSICPAYLEEASWACWRAVWEAALHMGTDLPSVFAIFAEAFGSEASFRSHASIDGVIERMHRATQELKRSALLTCLIPSHGKHRVENVFLNISVGDFAQFVGAVHDCAVVLVCSRMAPFTIANLVALCNIGTVEAVDLSNNPIVDDQFLFTLNTCLVNGKSSLKLLKVCGCPGVTHRGILALLQACESSLLAYIETEVRLIPESTFAQSFLHRPVPAEDAPVPGTNWRAISEQSTMAMLGRQSLAMKFHYILRVRKLVSCSSVLWDFKFLSEVADQFAQLTDLHDAAWRQRLQCATMKKFELPYMYIKDTGMDVVLRVMKHKVKLEHAPDAPREPEMPPESAKCASRKPRRVITDANSFFFGA